VTLASTLLGEVSATLLDESGTTWTSAELLTYLNNGIAQACGTLLDIYVVANEVALTAGVRQVLPADGLMLIDIPRTGDGTAVTQQAMNELARTRPSWPNDPASDTISYFMYDRRSPKTFLVYPAATGAGTAELVYAATPPVMNYLADEIPIDATFNTALWAYVLGMAYSKNSKRQDMTKATSYMGLFTSILDSWKKTKDSMVAPPDLVGSR